MQNTDYIMSGLESKVFIIPVIVPCFPPLTYNGSQNTYVNKQQLKLQNAVN